VPAGEFTAGAAVRSKSSGKYTPNKKFKARMMQTQAIGEKR
jgi:hypothetical protein